MAEKEKKKKKDEWADRLHEVYEDWGSYMSYKKAKLEEQYKEEVGTDFANASTLFKGISIFVNGYTDPPSDELRRLMMAHGGVFHHYLRTGKTTHIIATNLPYSKIVAYKKAQNPLPLCKPEWLTDSIKAGRVLDYRKYLLYSQHTKTQPKLAHVFVRNNAPQTKISQKENSLTVETIENEKVGTSGTSGTEKSVLEGQNEGQGQPEPTIQTKSDSRCNREVTVFTSTQQQPKEILPEPNQISGQGQPEPTIQTKSDSKCNREVTVFTSTQQQPKETLPEPNQSSAQGQPEPFQAKPFSKSNKEATVFTSTQQPLNKSHPEPNQKSAQTSTERNCTKNEQFLQEFYNNSRLHHISTMGAMFKEYINEKREKHNGEFSGLANLLTLRKMNQPGPSTRSDLDFDLDGEEMFEPKSNQETVIMHIDMDCFFVSVGLRNNPHLRGLPVAVAHAKSNKTDEELGSMSELASCSYEARKAGVKNGMFLGQAIKLCPNLKTIRYDFEGYKEVSFCLYDTVASYTMQIEAVSCDEMYVDCTELLTKSKLSSMEFANILRREINEKTGCPVSTGFGSNKLQARLATKKAKPNGQFHLKQEEIFEFIGSLAVKDLPGVGYSTASKLKQMNVQNCADLQKVSLGDLQKEFGTKSGQLLYSMCRGIDNSKLNLEHVRKSVSAEVNYGIRFENEQDARNFLTKLSLEVSQRLKKVNAAGRSVTLKLMVRAKEAPREARKFMGHGVCDYFTKTKNLMTAVDDVSIITKEILSLWNQMQKEPEEIRGIGIQMSRLESKKSKSASSILLNFIEKGNKDKKQASSSEEKVSESSPEMEFEEPSIASHIDKEDEENSINPASKSNVNLPIRSQPKTQTKPEDFFKKTKATVSRNAKVELPSLQEIDMAVLVELPENIRNEILNEYKTRNSSNNEMRLENPAKSPPRDPKPIIVNKRLEQVRIEEDQNESEISFSQVDPDFLAALSEDMRNDVKMYCQMRKREKEVNKKTTLVQPTLSKPTFVKPKRGRPRKTDKIANAVCEKKAKKSVEIEKKVDNKIHSKKMMTERSEVQVFMAKKTVEKAKSPKDVIVFDNARFGISDAKVRENQEILTRLVDCMLELPLMQAKGQVQAWIMNSESVDEIDLLSVVTYLGILPKKKRIDDLHTLLKTMHRCVTEVGNCVWHETYKKIVEHIQYNMQLEYNCDLMLSPVGCNNCMR